jgi:Bacterial Ig-like domain (group 3)
MIAVAGLGAIAAPSMAADFRVTTTTTLVASPTAVDSSASVTLTANVLPGFLVGPLGNVKFTDSTNGVVLGTIRPKLDCILRRAPCVATLSVPGSTLAPGSNAVVANYSGGLFTKPSSGSATVFVGTQTTCQPGTSPCSTKATSSDGLTRATINATPPGTGTETVQAFFNGEQLPCANNGTGDTLNFTVTNSGGPKTITLTLIGAAADAEHALDPDSLGHVCYESPSSFLTNANVQSTQGPDGLFFGNLPLCDDQDGDNDNEDNEAGGNLVVPAGAFPCINFVDAAKDTWATYTPASGSTQSTYTESFTTTASDPKAHG